MASASRWLHSHCPSHRLRAHRRHPLPSPHRVIRDVILLLHASVNRSSSPVSPALVDREHDLPVVARLARVVVLERHQNCASSASSATTRHSWSQRSAARFYFRLNPVQWAVGVRQSESFPTSICCCSRRRMLPFDPRRLWYKAVGQCTPLETRWLCDAAPGTWLSRLSK